MRLLNSKDYAASARNLCTYSFAVIFLYPILGLISVGVQEATKKRFLVIPVEFIDLLVSYLPFLFSVLGVISALIAVWKGQSRKTAVIAGLGNAIALLFWFFIHWIVQTK